MAQARAITTRNTILVAAARVFEREGFEGASISDILEEAQTTKGALYFHFKSKEALAVELVEDHPSWITSNMRYHDNPLQTTIDLSYRFLYALKMSTIVRASVRLALENPRFLAPSPEKFRGWVSSTSELLLEADKKGYLHEGLDAQEVAYHLASAVTGIVVFSRAFTGSADTLNRVQQMWQLSLPGITTPDVIDTLDFTAPTDPPAIQPSNLEAGLEKQFK